MPQLRLHLVGLYARFEVELRVVQPVILRALGDDLIAGRPSARTIPYGGSGSKSNEPFFLFSFFRTLLFLPFKYVS